MFTKMLLDALHKAPPQSLEDLRAFFDRSRARLEQSLDKGNVGPDERARYLDQFEDAVQEAQLAFIDSALGDSKSAGATTELSGVRGLGRALRQPLVAGLAAAMLLVGLAIGLML